MESLIVSKYKFSDLISQAFNNIHSDILKMFKGVLEEMLLRVRDEIIGGKRYRRGLRYKRWGYTIRKWVQTPIGILSGVKVPRVRSYAREISLFMDRYIHRSMEIEEILLEGYLWGISSRRLRIWSRRIFGDVLSHSSICKIKDKVRGLVRDMRESVIGDDIRVLVIDGIFGRYRKRGRGVVLVALGIDVNGGCNLLDWLGCDSENTLNWSMLFRRLIYRGLKKPELIVSDGGTGITEAISRVWKTPPRHQICLWHLQNDMIKNLKRKDLFHKRHIIRDYWEIFDGLNETEARERLRKFYNKWEKLEEKALKVLKRNEPKIFLFYKYPISFRHRLKTTNLAEGFFRHLRTFLRRFPGWINENHINLLLGIYLLGINTFKHNLNNIYSSEMPKSILNINFNRIY